MTTLLSSDVEPTTAFMRPPRTPGTGVRPEYELADNFSAP
jgi:hypothetical protein